MGACADGAGLAKLGPVSKNLKNIGIVSLLTIVSRFLGLARDLMSAAIFGTVVWMDAFVTAFSLPNLFRRLLGEGALTAAFVPTLQAELQARERAGAFAVLSNVASWLLVVTLGLVGLAMLVFMQARQVTFDDPSWYAVAELSVWLFPYMVFVCVAATFSAALHVLGRFTEPALSPIWLNLAMIASLGMAATAWVADEKAKVAWLCGGVLVGGFLQMMVPAAVLMRLGWRPRLDLTVSEPVREIARLMAPGLIGTAIYQVNVYVSRLFAFEVERSAATLMFFANRLMELPIGVFAIAVATVVYPLIARHAAARDFVAMADDYRKGLRLILLINIPAAAGLAVLSEPIVRVLFERGRFTAADTQMMAPLLALFALGMPFFAVTSLMTRAFYAVRDMRTTVLWAGVSFLVNLGASLVLMGPLKAPGLVLASTLAVLVQTAGLQFALTRRLPAMEFTQLRGTLVKILLAVALMAGVLVVARRLSVGLLSQRAGDWLAIAGLIPIGVAVYAAALWLLRIEGREELAAVVQKVRGRLG